MNTLPTNIGNLRLSDLLKIQGVTVIVNVTAEATPPPIIMPPPLPTERMLRKDEVAEMTGLSVATIYSRIKKGCFPNPIKDGKRCSRWRLSEVREWMDNRKDDS